MLAFMAELSRGRAVSLDGALRVGAVALGARGRREIDLARMSAVEAAERWFRSPHMRALAIMRSQFSGLPPWYPGTAAVFCLTPGGHGRRFSRPEGGSRAFVDALVGALVEHGGRIRRDFPVSRVGRRGTEWTLHAVSGDVVTASTAVVSAIPPQDMVLGLLDPEIVPSRIRQRFEKVEVLTGNLGQFSLAAALREAPALDHLPPGFEGAQLWMLQEPGAALEVAAAAFAGTLAQRPGLLATIPSVIDPTAAPAGAATMWINGFVGQRLVRRGGWTAGASEATERIWRTVESCLPGVSDLVTDSTFSSPDDLVDRTGALNAGAHVASTFGQLLAGRPVRGCADHRAGIDGLYLTGAGTNPGPGISGLPGRACAEALLDDLAVGRGDHRQRRLRVRVRAFRRELTRLGRLSALALEVRRDGNEIGPPSSAPTGRHPSR